ncbi:MAG: hypothetical protein IJP43_04890 [Oscillospiraceae bacterium]|nr:hypothetical protein [Oscillospiraceae bacterium]
MNTENIPDTINGSDLMAMSFPRKSEKEISQLCRSIRNLRRKRDEINRELKKLNGILMEEVEGSADDELSGKDYSVKLVRNDKVLLDTEQIKRLYPQIARDCSVLSRAKYVIIK